MNKIIFLLLFLAMVGNAEAQVLQPDVNIYGREWLRQNTKLLLGLPKDTFAVPTKYDTIPFLANKAGVLYGWDISNKRWSLVGGGGSSKPSIYTDDGSLSSTLRTVTLPYGSRISWLANGGTYGQDSQKPPFWHFSAQDTIANNTYSSGGAAAIWERNTLFTTNRRQYHKGYNFINRWFASDSVRVESVGGDYAYNVRFERKLTRASTNTNRSVFAGATTDWDAAPNLIAWDVHSRPTGHSASQRSRGWWAGISSYPIMNANTDTLDYWIGYISMSRINNTNKIFKYIDYWAGGGSYTDGRVDSIFGFYSRYANVRNHFAGPTGFGLNNTGATANVDILGTMRLREGNQGAGKVLTSDANGWATWQTPVVSGLFAREDASNETSNELYFNNRTQNLTLDSNNSLLLRQADGSGSYTNVGSSPTAFYAQTHNIDSSTTNSFAIDETAALMEVHNSSTLKGVRFQADWFNGGAFRLQYNNKPALRRTTLPDSVRIQVRDTVTGYLYDYVGSIGGGISNANIGSGYRILLPGTQEIKTLYAGANVTIDSTTNANGLTISATSGGGSVNTNAGSGYRWLKPAGQEIKTAFGSGVVSIDSSTNTDALTLYANEANYEAYAALGGGVKASAVDILPTQATGAVTFTNSQLRIVALFINKPTTLTGVKVWVRTQGSYTGNLNNKVGLYSYSGGTLTLVASSTNDADLWKASANTYQSVPFSSTYNAAPGIYFVATLWNASATTTAPAFGGVTLTNAAMADLGFSNSAKLYGVLNTQGDLPSTLAMSSVTAAISPTWVGVY